MQWTTDTLFNRERFEAWMANQPANRAFDYRDICGCLVSSFIKENTCETEASTGHNYSRVGDVSPKMYKEIRFPEWLDELLRQRGGALFTIGEIRATYHRLYGIDVMENHPTDSILKELEEVK